MAKTPSKESVEEQLCASEKLPRIQQSADVADNALRRGEPKPKPDPSS